MFRSLTVVGLFVALSALSCAAGTRARAQSASQEPAKEQPPPPPAPPESATPATAPSKPDAAKPKKPKKVWTEEEMGKLGGKVNVVGDGNAGNTPSATQSGGQDASAYQRKLAPLRQKLEKIEAEMRELQSAKLGGKENIARRMEQLQADKKDVQGQIDAIEEEARKNGIQPGQLR